MVWSATQPELLMISHCVPGPTGSADRRRAWELLRLVVQSHRVSLACLVDGPVHLAHWRELSQLAQRLELEPAGTLWRWAGALLSVLHGPAGERLARKGVLQSTLDHWRKSAQYDVVLCTHRGLWQHALAVPARLRACDLADSPDTDATAPRDSQNVHALARRWRRLQAPLYRAADDAITSRCDVVTLPSSALAFDSAHANAAADPAPQARPEPCLRVVLPLVIDVPAGQRLLSALRNGRQQHALAQVTAKAA